jgi:hypothetical protein
VTTFVFLWAVFATAAFFVLRDFTVFDDRDVLVADVRRRGDREAAAGRSFT